VIAGYWLNDPDDAVYFYYGSFENDYRLVKYYFPYEIMEKLLPLLTG
jgi:hypothetical protein